MARKKKEIQLPKMPTETMMVNYRSMLEDNPEYSLEVDPTNHYQMSDVQKEFIRNYVQYKSIPLAASFAHLDNEKATDLFNAYSTQQEIRRINKAMYARQFTKKVLSTQELASWLSSLITDDDVPYADRLSTKDKVDVAKYLIGLNAMQAASLEDPSIITYKDVESKVKELSIESIKQLISADSALEEKDGVLRQINKDGLLSSEELAYLKTLSYDDLLKLLDTLNSGGTFDGKPKNG